MANKPSTRLRELRGSGYEIAKGQPDIRGWDVRDDARRKLGKVRELIFDIKARKVRYMVVDVHDVKELELEKRTVLIPIGLAQLDSKDDDVIVQQITPFQLRALPRYDKTQLGAKVEYDISQVFGRTHTTAAITDDADDTFYEHDHFNEENMHKRRGVMGTTILEQEREEARERELMESRERAKEREKDAIRREAELGQPVSFTDPDDVKRLEKQERRSDESEEEYLRRIRRNDSNR
jgi:sporulation protein YlmC with PRC-barrel domain